MSPADVSPALSVVSCLTTTTVSLAYTTRTSEHVTLDMERGGPTTPQVQARVATVPPTIDVPQEASVTLAENSSPVLPVVVHRRIQKRAS